MYLGCRARFLTKYLDSQPSSSVLSAYLGDLSQILQLTVSEFPKHFSVDQGSLMEDRQALTCFIVDRSLEFLDLVTKHLPAIERLHELKELSSQLHRLNTEVLAPAGADLSETLSAKVLTVAKAKLQDYFDRAYGHYENMLRLYQWESSGARSAQGDVVQKESALLEFGSLAVLYNNCLAIVNEVR